MSRAYKHYFDYVKELGGEYTEDWVCGQLAEELESRDARIKQLETTMKVVAGSIENNYYPNRLSAAQELREGLEREKILK